MQLNQQQIDEIVESLRAGNKLRSHKNYPWVIEDGVYDYEDHQVRLFIHNSFSYYIVSKMWVNNDERGELPDWLSVEWGTYPNLPPKPPKKQ